MKNSKNSTTDCSKNKSQNKSASGTTDCFSNSTKSSKKCSRSQQTNCSKNAEDGDFFQS